MENEILEANVFWSEIDNHIEKSADELIVELKNKKNNSEINIFEKELCIS